MAAASVAVRLVCYLLLLSADVNAVVAAAVCIFFLLAPFSVMDSFYSSLYEYSLCDSV